MPYRHIINLKDVNLSDLEMVGGKNASLGEMIQTLSAKGIQVPEGFATTTEFYKKFLAHHKLDKKIEKILSSLQVDNVIILEKVSKQIQRWIIANPFPKEFEKEVAEAYSKLTHQTVAVRSSATAEDLETASFAGQQETFLNVKGIKQVLIAIKLVFASLFTSRAIGYRHHHKFDFNKVAISAGIQCMVRSDKGVSGVIFTLDTESGFDQVILINASYGLGEGIVQGKVNPDEFYVAKPLLKMNRFAILQRSLGEKAIKVVYNKKPINPRNFIKTIPVKEADRLRFCLSDKEIQALAKQALIIEEHYGKPMDIEWAD